MTCASCVKNVEDAISATPGVSQATVNFATGEARVFSDGGRNTLEAVVEAVEGAGYGVVTEKLEFSIAGMSCASCVQKIEQTLLSVQGIVGASVNLATGSGRVEYIAGGYDIEEAVHEAVISAGYRVASLGEREDVVTQREMRELEELALLKKKLFVGLSLVIPTIILVFWDGIGLGGFLPLGRKANFLLQFILITPVQFWVGAQFYSGALSAARHRTSNMNTLIAVGTSAAYLYSILATFFPHIFELEGYSPAVYYRHSGGNNRPHHFRQVSRVEGERPNGGGSEETHRPQA